MEIDFQNCSAREIASNAHWEDLIALVRGARPLTREHCLLLDHVYLIRIDRTLWGRADLEDLREFSAHLTQLANPLIAETLCAVESQFLVRWTAMRDRLEVRLEILETRGEVDVLQRVHVKEILALVADEPKLPQQRIEQRLGLGRSNLTRILNLMEEAGLVQRRRLGRENLIDLCQPIQHARSRIETAAQAGEPERVDPVQAVKRSEPVAAGSLARWKAARTADSKAQAKASREA